MERRRPNGVAMKLGPMRPGEHRYAVVIREDAALRLTLWIRHSERNEFFVMWPRGKGRWNPHASYHRHGRVHMKSRDRKVLPVQMRQPLTPGFRGSEHLGSYAGHAPKTLGILCDPAEFTDVLEIPPGTLAPTRGTITVDLVEPGYVA